MGAMASQITTVSIVQVQIKENTKVSRHWHLRGDSTDQRWIPLTKASDTEKSPFDDVLMRARLIDHCAAYVII